MKDAGGGGEKNRSKIDFLMRMGLPFESRTIREITHKTSVKEGLMIRFNAVAVFLLLFAAAGCTSAGNHLVGKSASLNHQNSERTAPLTFPAEGADSGARYELAANGSSCTANGAPDCGGTCSITCPVGQAAHCNPGRCAPNGSPVCTCQSRTVCSCGGSR